MREFKYKKVKDKIIIEIPFWSKRYNPISDEWFGKYPTLTGMVVEHRKGGNDWDDIGFALTIDMDYKGKDDQYTDIWFQYNGEVEEFEKLCKKWNIPFIIIKD